MFRNIISIAMLVLSVGLFIVYTKPTYDSTLALQAQVASYDAALAKATELQQRKQELLSRFNAMNPNDLDRLQKLLPDHVDNVRLILDFDNFAKQHGMALENVDVAIPGAEDTKRGTIPAGSVSGSKHEVVVVRFSTRGTYSMLQEFLRGIQSNLRLLDVISLSMSPGSLGGQGVIDGEPVYSFNVALKTYWLK
ncbi:hypothetical protein FJY94_00860 [Candidatus Kaiserbacteria bacterium]|nr:hypothetical protein [Candidatus Kaiserbacteria bacterium]